MVLTSRSCKSHKDMMDEIKATLNSKGIQSNIELINNDLNLLPLPLPELTNRNFPIWSNIEEQNLLKDISMKNKLNSNNCKFKKNDEIEPAWLTEAYYLV